MFGLLIGSLLFGPIADAIGRKRVLLVAVLVFGSCTWLRPIRIQSNP
ncbi:hypothetical protein M5585_07655 [Serratia ureilytica]